MFNGNGKETYQQIREIKGNLYAGRIYFKTAETDEITVESVGTNEKLGFQTGKDYLQHRAGQHRLCGIAKLIQLLFYQKKCFVS